MIDYKKIEEDVSSWDDDEKFYRDYYTAKQSGRDPSALFLRPEITEEMKNWITDPSTIPAFADEAMFFSPNENVTTLRHRRYYPFFTHSHEFFEMVYVLKGSCEEVTNDRSVTLHAGDLCLLAPKIDHGIRLFDDSIAINILIRHTSFREIFLDIIGDNSTLSLFFLGNLFDRKRIPYLLYHSMEDEEMKQDILALYDECQKTDLYSDRIRCSMMQIFFLKLSRRYGSNAIVPTDVTTYSSANEELIQYITTNYKNVTLNDTAEKFHFSVPYCSRLIREITGTNFSALVTKIRMVHAENLLKTTRMTTAQISEQVGYQNPETFIRAFERTHHTTPGKYRSETSA